MILGVLNRRLQAVVRLVIRGRLGQELETEVIVDTGYNGFLTLLGMALLHGHELAVEVLEGGSVSIRALPSS
jgi:hypothetical protein